MAYIRDVDSETSLVCELVRNDLVVGKLESERIVEVDDGFGGMIRARVGRGCDIGVEAVDRLHLAFGFAGNSETTNAVDTEAGALGSLCSGRHDASLS